MGRGPCTCCSRENLNRGPWTPEEDELLTAYIKRHGDRGNWRKVPKAAGLQRCGKSCRLRWLNYLRPDLKRGSFSEDEADLIVKLHSLLGNRWSIIAGRIPGRSDNEIKNYWNFHLSKKLLSMGINPKTHKPLNNNSCSKFSSTDSRSSRTSFGSVSSEDLPCAELTWLDQNDNFVAMQSPAISNSSMTPDEQQQQQQQLSCSKNKFEVVHRSSDKFYNRNSSSSSITSPCSSQSNDTCGSPHNSASMENPNWIQSALDSFHVSNENEMLEVEHNHNLVLSTMQQLQADLCSTEQQQEHDGLFDLGFLEDHAALESDGLLEVLGCL